MPRVEVDHLVDADDLAGEFDDGAGAFLEVAAGMGAFPDDLDDEAADAFTRGDADAAGSGGLGDEHVFGGPALLLDQGAAGRAADLLVGREQQGDRGGWSWCRGAGFRGRR